MMIEEAKFNEAPIDERFPKQWAAISKLHAIHKANKPEKLKKALAEIVAEYAIRSHPAGERERIRSDRQKYDVLATALGEINDVIAMLDGLNSATKSELSLAVAAITTDKELTEDDGYAEIVSRLADARRALVVLSAAWKITTGVSVVAPAHRPKNTFQGPTTRLALLWTNISGEQVVTPRRGPRGIASEPATEFIRRGLQMIYSDIKTPQVRTAIQYFLEQRTSLNEDLRQVAGDIESKVGALRLALAATKRKSLASKAGKPIQKVKQ